MLAFVTTRIAARHDSDGEPVVGLVRAMNPQHFDSSLDNFHGLVDGVVLLQLARIETPWRLVVIAE